jgi:ribosomal protein L22
MSRPAIDLIENGSYQKAAELMLRNIYQENYTKAQIDYWTDEIKRNHEQAKKTIPDFAIMPKTTAEKVCFAINKRMTLQTEDY